MPAHATAVGAVGSAIAIDTGLALWITTVLVAPGDSTWMMPLCWASMSNSSA